jgi:hypothetical protein
MAGKLSFKLSHATARQRASQAVLDAPEGFVVEIGPETRTQAQNRLFWPLVDDIRLQNSDMAKFSPDQVKLRFLNALDSEMQFLPELWGGGMFAVGQRSSTLSKRDFSLLVELVFKWGAENDICWSRKALDSYDEAMR